MTDIKETLAELREDSHNLTDNLNRKDVAQIAVLGLSNKDLENLKTLVSAEARTKNYAVLIRRLIAKAAKEIAERERERVVPMDGQTSIDDFL